MARTITLHGSDEILAMLGTPGTFYRGKWQKIKIVQPDTDAEVPLEVRKSLVGLVVPTIFTKERIKEQTGVDLSCPEGSRLAYAPDVINVLKSAGKNEAAKQLEEIVPGPLDMYVFEKKCYELV